MDYALICPDTVNGYLNSSESGSGGDGDGFCKGSGTDMFMDGYQLVLFGSDSLCLNFLFPSFTLSSRAKFCCALLVCFALGVAVEVLTSFRRKVFKQSRKRGKSARGTLTALHGAQALLGYLLMCLAMSYSVEVLGAVVLGLMAGHYGVNDENHFSEKADPCCDDFDYEEIMEEERESEVFRRKNAQREDGKPLLESA